MNGYRLVRPSHGPVTDATVGGARRLFSREIGVWGRTGAVRKPVDPVDADGPRHLGRVSIYFYSLDCNEPKHVHVQQGGATCKSWLEALALARNYGFPPHELNRIKKLIRAHERKIAHA